MTAAHTGVRARWNGPSQRGFLSGRNAAKAAGSGMACIRPQIGCFLAGIRADAQSGKQPLCDSRRRWCGVWTKLCVRRVHCQRDLEGSDAGLQDGRIGDPCYLPDQTACISETPAVYRAFELQLRKRAAVGRSYGEIRINGAISQLGLNQYPPAVIAIRPVRGVFRYARSSAGKPTRRSPPARQTGNRYIHPDIAIARSSLPL